MELIINSAKYGRQIVFFDEIDYPLIKRHNWFLSKTTFSFYARTKLLINKKYVTGAMHVLMMGKKVGKMIDHKDRNGLNNKRENLRYCTQSQNTINMDILKCNTSGFKGVVFNKDTNKWRTRLRVNGKLIDGGLFIDKIDAAKKYNEMAFDYFGEFAYLNQI